MDVMKFPAFDKVDVAKRMVASNDYAGARSKLLEVHYQFPSLENLPKMIAACNVLCASELTFSDGDYDWYWVLQLSPVASISQVRSQHKKLVTILEGIKEEFPEALTALKLVHEAFFILSNPSKRLVFDSRRLTSWSTEPTVSPVSSIDNAGSHNDNSLIQEVDTLGCESSVSRKIDATNVLGAVDEKGLKIIELDGPSKLPQDGEVHNFDEKSLKTAELDGFCSMEVNSISDNKGQTSENTLASAVHPGVGNNKAEDFEVGQIWATFDDENLPRRYARINAILDLPFTLVVTWLRPVPENDDEEKWCEAGLPVVCGFFSLHGDDENLVDHSTFSHWVSYTASPTYDEFRIHPQEDEIWAIYEKWTPFEWFDKPESRKGCNFQTVKILYLKEEPEEECVIVAEHVKLDESQNICIDTAEGQESFEIPSSCFYRFSHRLPSFEPKEIETGPASPLEPVPSPSNASCSNFQSLPSLPVPSGSSLKVEWTVKDFAPGQVWAIYDGPDQMPRRYVVVSNLVSNRIVSANLLEPHPMHEEEICWVEEHLPLGCGVFRVNSAVTTLQMSKFSHLVNCDRSTKQSFYRIYPKRGEVWAMYRNWNSKWKKHDFNYSHCRIVQITSDFCEQSGVQVASLEHVPGFKTFFQKQLCDGFALNRVVRRTEMLGFSHRVEAFIVPGIQAHGIPDGAWHLEPDALPLVLSN